MSFPLVQFGYNLSTRDTGKDTCVAILQTFGSEAFLFAKEYGVISWNITAVFLFVSLVLVLIRVFRSTFENCKRGVSAAIASVSLLWASYILIPTLEIEFRKAYGAVKTLEKEKTLFTEAAPNFAVANVSAMRDQKLSIVTIIGESTSRWNVSLYGYPRSTFQPLEDLQNLIVFDDAISSNTHTISSLLAAFTSADYHPIHGTNWLEQPAIPLIGILNNAGVQTYWFSNQNEYGVWDSPVSHHGKMAHESYFHRKSVDSGHGGHYFEGSDQHDLHVW